MTVDKDLHPGVVGDITREDRVRSGSKATSKEIKADKNVSSQFVGTRGSKSDERASRLPGMAAVDNGRGLDRVGVLNSLKYAGRIGDSGDDGGSDDHGRAA